MTPEQLAQIAYEAWWQGMRVGGGVKPQRGWGALQSREQKSWIAAAQAVKANVLSGFTKVGEGEVP